MRIIISLPIILLALFLTACTTSSDRSRGSLSGAMDKARDDHEGSREVPDEEDPWWEDDEDDDWGRDDSINNDPDEEINRSAVSSTPFDDPLAYLFRYGTSLGGSPYFSGQKGGDFLLGFSTGPTELLLYAGIYQLETSRSHDVYESIGGSALLLNAGGELRYYPFEKLDFFSPYLGARVGGIYMSWSFENPLSAGADTIYSDALGGLSLGVCAGADLVRTEHLRLGAQLNPEAYFFGGETSQGFENDYFGAQGMVKLSIEGGFRF